MWPHPSRRTLEQNEFAQGLDLNPTSEYPLNGGKTRIIPTIHMIVVNKPLQFTFGQHGMHKIHSRKRLDRHRTQLQCFNDPLVLKIPIVVLGRTQGMCHTFDRVDDGTGKIVRGVRLVLGPGSMMRCGVRSIQDGVTESFVFRLHVNLGPQTISLRHWISGAHGFE